MSNQNSGAVRRENDGACPQMPKQPPTQPTQPMPEDQEHGAFVPDEPEAMRRWREEDARWRKEEMIERDKFRRQLFNIFNLWKVCEHKVCHRNKGCRGNTDECVMKRWRRVVPDEVRNYVGKIAHYVANEGMTTAEAIAATDADFKRYQEIEAKRLTDANDPA
jgi:hypothetical protein